MADMVFEPNEPRLWARIRRELTAYFGGLFQRGALKGRTDEEAFYVKCDAETNPPAEREAGTGGHGNRTGAGRARRVHRRPHRARRQRRHDQRPGQAGIANKGDTMPVGNRKTPIGYTISWSKWTASPAPGSASARAWIPARIPSSIVKETKA